MFIILQRRCGPPNYSHSYLSSPPPSPRYIPSCMPIYLVIIMQQKKQHQERHFTFFGRYSRQRFCLGYSLQCLSFSIENTNVKNQNNKSDQNYCSLQYIYQSDWHCYSAVVTARLLPLLLASKLRWRLKWGPSKVVLELQYDGIV